MLQTKKKKTEKAITPARKPAKKAKSVEGVAPAPAPGKYVFAVGRRKESVALVRLYGAKGAITVNGKTLAAHFTQPNLQGAAQAPFSELKIEPLRIEARVQGGGVRGQAEALRLAISRALVASQPEFKARLRAVGFLTRDARVKERRKYGLKKARRAPQWSKR